MFEQKSNVCTTRSDTVNRSFCEITFLSRNIVVLCLFYVSAFFLLLTGFLSVFLRRIWPVCPFLLLTSVINIHSRDYSIFVPEINQYLFQRYFHMYSRDNFIYIAEIFLYLSQSYFLMYSRDNSICIPKIIPYIFQR